MSRCVGYLAAVDGAVRGHVLYSCTIEALHPEVADSEDAAWSSGEPDGGAVEACRGAHRGEVVLLALHDVREGWHVSYCAACGLVRGPFRAPTEPTLMDEARGFVAACAWRDIAPEDVPDLDDDEIRACVERHFAGGWVGLVEAV